MGWARPARTPPPLKRASPPSPPPPRSLQPPPKTKHPSCKRRRRRPLPPPQPFKLLFHLPGVHLRSPPAKRHHERIASVSQILDLCTRSLRPRDSRPEPDRGRL